MKNASAEFELRISAQWSMVPLIAVAVWLMASEVGWAGRPQDIENQLLGAQLISLLTVLWLVLAKWPVIGRWLLILSTSVTVVLARRFLDLPGTLSLLALPAGMAVAFISVRAGAATVVAQTVLVLGLKGTGLAAGGEIALSLVATWVTFGILGAVYHPVYQLANWSWFRYKESQNLIVEARDRRAELEQTLQALRRANRQLALDNQRVSALRTVADDAQRNKTAFVARVSHEFRAPLNMIIGLTGLMVDRPEVYAEELPPDLAADLEVIRRNSAHLAEMINDVLDLSQTELGRLTLHRESVDLVEIVDEALLAVSPLIHKKGLRLDSYLSSEPLIVYCDRTRIRQVLLNLLSNAARFTETGSITVAANGTETEVVVEVRDTGPGIAPHEMSRIFEPFYRAPTSAQKVTGSGLGLSISREIVQHHGGRIWLTSGPGHGTRFHFSLPTRQPVAPVARAGHEIVQEWIWREDSFHTESVVRRADLSRPLVIVYDPEDTVVREVQGEAQSVEVLVTHTVDESLATAAEYSAHAILVNTHTCDGESGVLLDTLRAAAPGALVLACDVPNPLARARAAGADAYLIKPISQESLSVALQRLALPVRSLLIVDDEPDGAQLISRMVRKLDASIDISIRYNGDSALAAMRSRRPDLVLLDVAMPGDDGWSVLASMREDTRLGQVPVFFVSGVDPSNTPPVSDCLTVTVEGGLPISRLVTASLELSRVLLARETGTTVREGSG